MVVCEPDQIRPDCIEGSPRLVVEISSPSTQRHDRVRKLELYGKFGVAEYWLVTPHPFMVEVLRNAGGLYVTDKVYTEQHTLRFPAFPDLNLDLAEVFANLPPQPYIEEVLESTRNSFSGQLADDFTFFQVKFTWWSHLKSWSWSSLRGPCYAGCRFYPWRLEDERIFSDQQHCPDRTQPGVSPARLRSKPDPMGPYCQS